MTPEDHRPAYAGKVCWILRERSAGSQGAEDLFKDIFYGIRYIVRVFRDTGDRVCHGIAYACRFQHLHVIVLVPEGDAFFGPDTEELHELHQGGPFVAVRHDKVDPRRRCILRA